MQRCGGQKKKKRKRKCQFYQNMSARVCVCVCDAVSRSEIRLIRFCLIGAAPHGRVRQPFPKATLILSLSHTHTHSSSSSGPDRHHEKLRLRSPSCCPELPTERPRNQAVRTTEKETKREKSKGVPVVERTREFVQVCQQCIFILHNFFK